MKVFFELSYIASKRFAILKRDATAEVRVVIYG
jgi:hypothetical protein